MCARRTQVYVCSGSLSLWSSVLVIDGVTDTLLTPYLRVFTLLESCHRPCFVCGLFTIDITYGYFSLLSPPSSLLLPSYSFSVGVGLFFVSFSLSLPSSLSFSTSLSSPSLFPFSSSLLPFSSFPCSLFFLLVCIYSSVSVSVPFYLVLSLSYIDPQRTGEGSSGGFDKGDGGKIGGRGWTALLGVEGGQVRSNVSRQVEQGMGVRMTTPTPPATDRDVSRQNLSRSRIANIHGGWCDWIDDGATGGGAEGITR